MCVSMCLRKECIRGSLCLWLIFLVSLVFLFDLNRSCLNHCAPATDPLCPVTRQSGQIFFFSFKCGRSLIMIKRSRKRVVSYNTALVTLSYTQLIKAVS